MSAARCLHRPLFVRRDPDGCSFVRCKACGKRGPRKHSYILALVAWALATGDQHPRNKVKR